MATTSASVASTAEPRSVRRAILGEEMPNLDFLRAVAVLLVLFSHLTFFLGYLDFGPLRILWMGVVGVYFFFVHTCLVLMMSLERQWKDQGAFSLFGSFMIRRIFRIYPLSLVVTILVLVFRLPMATYCPGVFLRGSPDAATVAANLLLVQSPEHSIVGPMWSLPYEMGMYLFLPWIFFFLYSRTSLWRVAVLWSISVVAGIAFLMHAGWPTRDYFVVYIPCFLCGVIAYQLQKTPRRQLPAYLWTGIVLLAGPLYLYNQHFLPNPRIKSWLICLMIGAAAPFFSQISARWLTIPAQLIAKYSYGIYLTHFFCIWLVFSRLHYVLSRTARLGLFVVLVFGLPVLLYHVLEEPMIGVGKRVARRFETRAARWTASRMKRQDAGEL